MIDQQAFWLGWNGIFSTFFHCEAKQAEVIAMGLELHMNVLFDGSHHLSHFLADFQLLPILS